jgi:beta-glucanase (GH16 family)
VYQQDGNLVLRAIPNLNKTSDNVDMLTGGIESSGRFTFNHGFVECRAKVNSYTGNFPAIWMMPADGTGGWPTCGEIDIMEQINAENKAYHTVHSHWTWDLGNKTNPTSSFNEAVDMSVYHTYGLEKMADTIRWYVDGVQKGQYYHVPANDASGQWPFDKAFYLILNQSVGNGSWAANPDVTHTYEFDVDWIRVYQSNASTGIEEANAAAGNLQSWATRGHLFLRAQSAVKVLVSDMAGRTVYNSLLQGTVSLPLSAGIYVVGQHKVLVP